MAFTLRNIPAAMRKEGWPVGAALMERWFAGRAAAMTPAHKSGAPWRDVETRLVTMDWARQFDRVTSAERTLIATWHSGQRMQAASTVIRRRLGQWRRAAREPNRPFRFGNLGLPTAEVDATCQINIQTFESGWFTSPDDLYAALGNATVKIAVAGVATPLANQRIRLQIDEIGTYVRDTYEFTDLAGEDQGLGSWGPTGLSRVAVLAPAIPIIAEGAKEDRGRAFWSVSNDSFRRYRAHYGLGGDFVILSNVSRQRLTRPVMLELAA